MYVIEAFKSLLWVSKFMDAVDPDTDAITSAASWHLLKPAQASRFESSWQSVGVVGPAVAFLGLPGMITSAWAIITLYQFTQLWKFYKAAKEAIDAWPGRADHHYYGRWVVWIAMHHIVDISGLTVMRATLKSVVSEQDLYPVDRSGSFFCKLVLEPVPNAWFSISLASLIVDTADTIGVASVFFTIGTSFYFMWNGIAQMIPVFCRWTRNYLSHGENSEMLVRNVPALGFAVLASVAMLCRLAGIWRCQSHILNLTSGCACLESE
mmetsp:Transcript_18615/g.60556  ORF Transcript_18615/g.60556 Transcript_18615/m.60556 type:complete len:266 (-) Transcript_18615:78-875(-)